MSNNVYFSVDGDDVGKLIERGLLENDELFLKETSMHIKQWLEKLTSIIVGVNGTVLMSGGDMLLAIISADCIEKVLSELSVLQKTFSFTCSAAVGRSMPEVYFALKLAKSKGKNHFIKLIDNNYQPISETKIVQRT